MASKLKQTQSAVAAVVGIMMLSPVVSPAKAPTTIVYAKPHSARNSFFILSNGSLSQQKVWQDRLQVGLKSLPSLKAYTFIPSLGRPLTSEELKNADDKLKAEGVTTLILLESVPLQQGTECQTSTENRIYNMPELGQQSSTTCSAVDDWIFRITVSEMLPKSLIAVSELRASEQGIFEGWSTQLGASRAKQMIDRMMKSLANAGAL
jgi:hypothetical protein